MAISDAVGRMLEGAMSLARGRVVRVQPSGKVLVRLQPEGGELLCDVLCSTTDEALRLASDDEVLVARPDVARQGAIVLGVVGAAAVESDRRTAFVDGSDAASSRAGEDEGGRVAPRRLVVEAGEELTLRCGEASIKITRDGKIVIRGDHILSRAKGTHRIKGGSVAIN